MLSLMLSKIKSKEKLLTLIYYSGQLISMMVPFIVILVYYIIRKDVYDFHQAILGTFLNIF